jgi:hypothetical protein
LLPVGGPVSALSDGRPPLRIRDSLPLPPESNCRKKHYEGLLASCHPQYRLDGPLPLVESRDVGAFVQPGPFSWHRGLTADRDRRREAKPLRPCHGPD